ncbi:MAG: HrgA protein [Magnetococcales bacterium]|nr:HrgA protein [Magnetococcales bacterium]
MAINLKSTVMTFLRDRPDEKFTTRQIADWIFAHYPAECQAKKQKSLALKTDEDLVRQLTAEISSLLGKPLEKGLDIKSTEGRPRKYYFTHKSDEDEVALAEAPSTSTDASTPQSTAWKEADLYPLLINYLRDELKIHAWRVDEKSSSNKRGPGGNKWLYPDMVAMEDLSEGWDREIKDCVLHYSDKKTRLWSFEVKRLINRSNVRETYFQAVSNSSWANFGYLVAAEIQGKDTLEELRLLFGLHGIGVIQFDPENVADSQLLIPAQEKTKIDWNTCNRLATENKDFMEFIRKVRRFCQTGDQPK